MSRFEGGLHGLKSNPSAGADDQNCHARDYSVALRLAGLPEQLPLKPSSGPLVPTAARTLDRVGWPLRRRPDDVGGVTAEDGMEPYRQLGSAEIFFRPYLLRVGACNAGS
jgi:hypothetical protein